MQAEDYRSSIKKSLDELKKLVSSDKKSVADIEELKAQAAKETAPHKLFTMWQITREMLASAQGSEEAPFTFKTKDGTTVTAKNLKDADRILKHLGYEEGIPWQK